MTRRVNLKGSRLGISNKWLDQSTSLKYNDLISVKYFIQNIVEGFFKKWNLGLLFLDIKIEQGKVLIDIIVQNKSWTEIRNKGKKVTKKFTKKQRKNHVRVFYIRNKIINKFFAKKNREVFHKLFFFCKKSYNRNLKLFNYLQRHNISPEHQKKVISVLIKKKTLLNKVTYAYYKYRKDSKRAHGHFLKMFDKHYDKTKYLNLNTIVFSKLLKLFLEKRLIHFLKKKYNVQINIFTVNELLKKYKYVARNTEVVYNDPRFHKYKKWYGKNFFDYILILNLGLFFQRPKYITDFLSLLLRYNRRHSSTCYMVFNLLNTIHYYYSNISSLKLMISGRFHGTLRKEKRIFQTESSLQSQRLDLPLDFGFSEAYTYCGVFGIKLWMLKKKVEDSVVERHTTI